MSKRSDEAFITIGVLTSIFGGASLAVLLIATCVVVWSGDSRIDSLQKDVKQLFFIYNNMAWRDSTCPAK